MRNFQNKIVFITGSTRGIGKAIAQAFAEAGATVIITGRNAGAAQKVAAELTAQGLKADGYALDVANMSNVQEIVNNVLDKHKTIDILINNAGITKDNLLLRMKESDWDDVISVNLRGAFNCSKVISKVMMKARYGRIINMSSIIGITGNVGQANYAASKAGLIGLTKSLALEFASRGITANAIAPGYIMTEMTEELKEETQQQILKQIPLGKFGTASDVAGCCLFLASDGARYITGQTLVVDGGMAI